MTTEPEPPMCDCPEDIDMGFKLDLEDDDMGFELFPSDHSSSLSTSPPIDNEQTGFDEKELEQIVKQTMEKIKQDDEKEERKVVDKRFCGILDENYDTQIPEFREDFDYNVEEPENEDDLFPDQSYNTLIDFKTIAGLKNTLRTFANIHVFDSGKLINGMSFSLIQNDNGEFLPISEEEIKCYEFRMGCSITVIDDYDPRTLAEMNSQELYAACIYAARKLDLYLLKRIAWNNPSVLTKGVRDLCSVINWEAIPSTKILAWIEFIELCKGENITWDSIFCSMLCKLENPDALGNTWLVEKVIKGELKYISFANAELKTLISLRLKVPRKQQDLTFPRTNFIVRPSLHNPVVQNQYHTTNITRNNVQTVLEDIREGGVQGTFKHIVEAYNINPTYVEAQIEEAIADQQGPLKALEEKVLVDVNLLADIQELIQVAQFPNMNGIKAEVRTLLDRQLNKVADNSQLAALLPNMKEIHDRVKEAANSVKQIQDELQAEMDELNGVQKEEPSLGSKALTPADLIQMQADLSGISQELGPFEVRRVAKKEESEEANLTDGLINMIAQHSDAVRKMF